MSWNLVCVPFSLFLSLNFSIELPMIQIEPVFPISLQQTFLFCIKLKLGSLGYQLKSWIQVGLLLFFSTRNFHQGFKFATIFLHYL